MFAQWSFASMLDGQRTFYASVVSLYYHKYEKEFKLYVVSMYNIFTNLMFKFLLRWYGDTRCFATVIHTMFLKKNSFFACIFIFVTEWHNFVTSQVPQDLVLEFFLSKVFIVSLNILWIGLLKNILYAELNLRA